VKSFLPENIRTWIIRGAIFSIGGGFVLASYLFVYSYYTVKIPDPNAYVNSQATVIEYADGSTIGRIGAEDRTSVPLATIPMNVRHAIMAAEDRNFYSERAFSPTGIMRALYHDLMGGSLQGGSTITQQYAKTAFLTPQRSIQRKIKEIVIAVKLEQQQSKDQILENYLNTIYFGRGAYGVQTASQVFFNKDVNQLSVSQAAVLASVLNAPGYYDPANGPSYAKRLKDRWKYVLDGMVKAHWLTAKEEARMSFPLIQPRVSSGSLAGPKGYVISWVENQLQGLGFSQDQLMQGGLVVKTTLVKKDQEAAVDAVAKRTPADPKGNLRVALVSIKPGTGEVVAMYGGQDYLKSQLNNATQAITEAGSSFKPFTLVAALQQGISLHSLWNGTSPQVFYDPGSQSPYPVFNYGNEQFPNVNLLDATANSVNTVFVPLAIKVGPQDVINVARAAGIPDSVAMVASPSVTLGVASPHVIDVAAAYATFAAQGIYAKPYIVSEVLGSNQGVLYQAQPQSQQVFASDVMADLTSALQTVTARGTAAAALADLGRPSAGKTGTTTDNASAWFNGYTPQLATTVALFRDNATQSLNGIGGLNAVTGGSFPAKIWDVYTKEALAGEPIVDFPAPANIGGVDPTPMQNAVPTLDPALAASASPKPIAPTHTSKATKKPAKKK
jgi:membrane peptidoglycan carboxypeptidase